MFKRTTLAFIGSGTMGEAMIKVALDKGLISPQQIIASDIRAERGAELVERYGVRVTTDNPTAVDGADIVVLAVKPQNLGEVMATLKGVFQPRQLILSIIAGARIDTIGQGLDHRAIVRAMPNTPAQIGLGMTVWTATPEVTEHQKGWARITNAPDGPCRRSKIAGA